MNWERYKETAMEPNKSSDSIIVSKFSFLLIFHQLVLRNYERVMLKRYIENELKQEGFITMKEYQQIKDEVLLFSYFAGHGC